MHLEQNLKNLENHYVTLSKNTGLKIQRALTDPPPTPLLNLDGPFRPGRRYFSRIFLLSCIFLTIQYISSSREKKGAY